MPKVLNWAGYRFMPLERLEDLRAELLALCERLSLKGTILLAPEGINAFAAGDEEKIAELERELQLLLRAPDFVGKRSWSEEVPFRRLFVRIKPEIIPAGAPATPTAENHGRSIEAKELKRWYDEKKDFTMLDTRNTFEFGVGSFENAIELGLRTFREFAGKVDALPEEAKRKPLVMFCTGGIRCEKASLLLERAGFQDVLQLEGGILKYFEECGGAHYRGACFVFDERVAVNSRLEPTEVPEGIPLMADSQPA